ncbi:MAG: thioredoxin fold domain-containing protein [Bacteroidota bacterium]
MAFFARPVIFLLILPLFLEVVQAKLPFNSLPEGEFAALREEAIFRQLPFLTYFYQKDSKECKQMEKKTWEDQGLLEFLHENFLAQQHHILTSNIELIQELNVFSAPTIIIFSPDGKMMGRVEGYVAPSTLLSILGKHLKTLGKRETVPQFVVADVNQQKLRSTYPTLMHESVEKEPQEMSLGITDIAESHYRISARSKGVNKHPVQRTIPHLEPYSLENLPEGDPYVYGLLIGNFSSFKQLKHEVKQIQRFWKGRIWVYSEEIDQVQIYKLALGAYPSLAKAESFAKAMKRFEKLDTSVINLSQLVAP